jgi:hypothetical protein
MMHDGDDSQGLASAGGHASDAQRIAPGLERSCRGRASRASLRREARPVMTGYGRWTELFRRDWLEEAGRGGPDFRVGVERRERSVPGTRMNFATDRISVVQGELRLALYDARPASPTRGLDQRLPRVGVAAGPWS